MSERSQPTTVKRIPRVRVVAALAAALLMRSAGAELPTVCAPCDAGGAMVTWTNPGSASRYIVDGAKAYVKQALERETFNWKTFNIGPDNTVTFEQPTSASVALNRIFQNDPSRIFGALKANGQVILINQNGILFERGASVDVNTLVASSLEIADAARENLDFARVVESDLSPAFKKQGAVAGDVNVAAGATLRAQENGRVILIGGNVDNAGRIEVSGRGGQALLAAENDEVYLYLEDDPNVRGLAVALTEGGTVTNGGTILAERGNITLAGLTVNQSGVAQATTAVDANGSIRLVARDQSRPPEFAGGSGDLVLPEPRRGGDVNFAPGSMTVVNPRVDDAATVIDGQPIFDSLVAVDGENVTVGENATISAASGTVSITAAALPEVDSTSSGTLAIERGARIDVAGLDDVEVSVARNFVEQEVRRNELADVPVQRDGPLFGETVTFDVRKPLPRVVNVEAAVANVERTVAERATVGGEIVLNASDRIDIAAGAILDASGGILTYTPALVSSTKLIVEGRVIDISEAPADIAFDAVLRESEFVHEKWGPQTTEYFSSFGPAQRGALSAFEPGYIEGKDAGAIRLRAPVFDIAGDLVATTARGLLQTDESGAAAGFARPFNELAEPGSLALISSTLEHDLVFGANGFGFDTDGIGQFDIAVGNFELAAGAHMALPARGSLTVRAADTVTIGGAISATGGTLTFDVNPIKSGIEKLQDDTGSISVTSGARIDLEGGWFVDDSVRTQRLYSEARFIDGGVFTASVVGDVDFMPGSFIDVGGGAFVGRDGTVEAGAGGAITVSNATFLLLPETVDTLESAAFSFASQIEGYTFPDALRGASLSLTAPQIVIGMPADVDITAPGTFSVDPAIFTEYGFSDFVLQSRERVIGIENGLQLGIRAKHLTMPSMAAANSAGGMFELPPGGTDIDAFAIPRVLDPSMRSPTSLVLDSEQVFSTISGPTAPNEALVVPADTVISVDTGGDISLANAGSIVVAGTLQAPGGDVNLATKSFGSFGYLPDFAIWLDSGSLIDVSGRILPAALDGLGRVNRVESFDAGTVSINSRAGYLVALPDATVDVSGAAGSVTTSASDPRSGEPMVTVVDLGTDAGTIDLISGTGIRFYADVDGATAPGTGAAGATLSVTLDGRLRIPNQGVVSPNVKFPARINDGVEEMVVQLGRTTFPDGIVTGEPVPDALFEIAAFSIDNFNAGGFVNLDLAASPNTVQKDPTALANASSPDPLMESVVELVGDGAIEIPERLTINAPVLQSDGGNLSVRSTYLKVGFVNETLVTSDSPVPLGEIDPPVKYFSAEPGEGAASFSADFIDFEGFTSLHGFGASPERDGAPVTFTSTGDLRFRGVRSPNEISLRLEGALIAESDVLLRADRFYGSALTDFLIANTLDDGLVTFAPSGSRSPAVPLSAGSRLRVVSDRIEQLGDVYAPVGSITLDASSDLVLGSDSLTSVTAAGSTIPFGRIEIGEWVFPFRDLRNNTVVLDADPDVFDLPPEKQITFIADGFDGVSPIGEIDIRPGATLDVRSGGSLVATEFLPGPLGKQDILDARAGSGTFALLPLAESGIAAYDPLDSPGFGFGPTTQLVVTDGGDSGLAAGTYAVLPPRYALLPGGLLLTPDADAGTQYTVNANPTVSAAGLPLAAGAITQLGAARDPAEIQYFSVERTADLLQRAEYRVADADTFFAEQALDRDLPVPLLPRDSGAISIVTNAGLNLGGTITSERNIDGVGSRVDISAQRVAIGHRGEAVDAGVVLLEAGGLEALNANSILIGGIRTATGESTRIDTVTAEEIVVTNDTSVDVAELILVASDRIELRDGARVSATGAPATGSGELSVRGSGALLLATSGELPAFSRSGTGGGAPGLFIDGGASVAGSGGLIFDSSGEVKLNDAALTVGDGGGAYFGAERILIGDAPPAESGLRLSADLINGFAVDSFTLVSQTSVDFFDDVDLFVDFLTIDAGGLVGATGAGTVRVSGDTIELGNSGGANLTPGAIGSGSLILTATTSIELGLTAGLNDGAGDDGDFDILGFGTLAASAPLLLATDIHHLDSNAAVVSLSADVVTARSGGEFDFRADGTLSLDPFSALLGPVADLGDNLGGRVALDAASLDVATRILTPSGTIELNARDGDLRVAAQTVLDVAGLDNERYGPARVNSPGGIVGLRAGQGDVVIESGAAIDVSAGRGDFTVSGGVLEIVAGAGRLQLPGSGTIAGSGNGTGDGAALRVDIGGFADDVSFSSLNNALAPGDFSGERSVRVRGAGEHLVVGQADVVRAHDIRLVADNGDVVIAGELNASGERGGTIDVAAGNDLVLANTARLWAQSTGGYRAPTSGPDEVIYDDGFRGGVINLASAGGRLVFETAADKPNLQVGGTRADSLGGLVANDNGLVRLTAPRTAANGVELGSRAAGGAYTHGAIEAQIGGAARIEVVGNRVYTTAETGTVIGQAGVSEALTGSGIAGQDVRILPGVEVVSPTNMNANAVGLNFNSLFNAASVTPGVLTLRSGADLTIASDIRDGTAFDAFFSQIADANESWSLRFVSGADLASADPLATVAGGGNLVVNPGVDIWTGTGDIVLASGGDITLRPNATVASIGRHADLANYLGAYTGSFFFWTSGISYPDHGGDIDIVAGGNIDIATSSQTVKDFTYYFGQESDDPFAQAPRAWGYTLGALRQNVTSLAGGDINIRAGGDLGGGQFTVATSGRQDGEVELGFVGQFDNILSEELTELGGGELSIFARGAIDDIDATVLRGAAQVRSYGDIGTGSAPGSEPRLFIGDAAFAVEGARNVSLGLIVDPTQTNASVSNPAAFVGSFATSFLSMTQNSSLDVYAAAGDLLFDNPSSTDAGVLTAFPRLLNMLPSRSAAVAASGNIYFGNFMSAFPAPRGTFRFVAKDDVAPAPGLAGVIEFTQYESDPGALVTSDLDTSTSGSLLLGFDVQGTTVLHAGDRESNLVISAEGDVRNLELNLAKSTFIDAGRDISRIALDGKHVNTGDTSVFTAGRDIVQPTVRNGRSGALLSSRSSFYTLQGPGEFTFIAGRDIDLGTSSGIVSVGATRDQRLPARGAAINLFAGLNEPAAITEFVTARVAAEPAYAEQLQTHLDALRDAGRLFDDGASQIEQFASLGLADQVALASDIFFEELKASGVSASDPNGPGFEDYSRGFDAVAGFFPGDTYGGNIRTPLSTVQTREGGSIRVHAPGGLVDAGLTATDGLGSNFKGDDELGFIVFREGDIKAFVNDDFNVNSTRVFAQQGGDILIWSSTGDIDAGRGAKSATSLGAPPSEFDAFGNFLDKPPLQVVGSGIRNFAPADVEPGTLFLFAPQGIVDAGDAGIGSAGNIVIGATEVIGADNIDIGGIAIGVPTSDTGGIAAGLTSVGDVAAGATNATQEQAARAGQQAAAESEAFDTASLSIIQVEVLGFGT